MTERIKKLTELTLSGQMYAEPMKTVFDEADLLLPKQQINIVVETAKVPEIIEIVKQELYTGHIGDGKIFVYGIDNVIRVRTGDEGMDAL